MFANLRQQYLKINGKSLAFKKEFEPIYRGLNVGRPSPSIFPLNFCNEKYNPSFI